MSTSSSTEDRDSQENRSHLRDFEQAHKEEIEAISLILAKITHRTLKEVKCKNQQTESPKPANREFLSQDYGSWQLLVKLTEKGDKPLARASLTSLRSLNHQCQFQIWSDDCHL